MFWIVSATITAIIVILLLHSLKQAKDNLVKIIITFCIPIGSLGVYFYFGSVDMPDFPYEQNKEFYQAQKNKPVGQLPIFQIITKLETQIIAHPDDHEAPYHLSMIYMKMKNYKQAKEILTRFLKEKSKGNFTKHRILFKKIIALEANGI